jgi:hypothetical protein
MVQSSWKFYQTGEVDQELEYEMHQTEYKVMIGCVMDWPSWRLLILFTLVMRNGKSRETYLQRDDVVKPKP